MAEYVTGILKAGDEAGWRSYVDASARATFFHLLEWKGILKESYGYEPHYIVASDAGGNTMGVFPLFLVKSRFFGRSLKSLPFHFLGGPLYSSRGALDALLTRARELCGELAVSAVHAKCYDDYGDVPGFDIRRIKTYSSPEIPLSGDYERVASTFSRNVQRDIRYGLRDNEVTAVDTQEGLTDFYRLFTKSCRDIGLPQHDFRLFRLLWDAFSGSGMVRITMARHEDRFTAAHVALCFKQRILYMWGALDREFKNRLGMQALQGEAIQWGCRKGFRYYDFGWTSPVEEGALRYKSRWGTSPRDVNFYSFFGPAPKDRDYHISFKIQRALWRRLPAAVAARLGPVVAKEFG